MKYYKRILSLLLIISISFTLLVLGQFLWNVLSKEQARFSYSAQETANVLSEYTDTRLMIEEYRFQLLSRYNYTQFFVEQTEPYHYNIVQLYNYIRSLDVFSSEEARLLALTFFTNNYCIMNDRTGDLNTLYERFFIDEKKAKDIIEYFSDNLQENYLFFTTKTPNNTEMLTTVRIIRTLYPSPVYIFTQYSQTYFFNREFYDYIFMELWYKSEPVFAAGNQSLKNTKNSHMVSIPSEQHNFSYTFYIEKQTVNPLILFAILFLGVIIITGIILLMLLLTRKLYQPVKNIMMLTNQGKVTGDEFVHLTQTITGLYRNMETMKTYSQKMKNDFFVRLLKSDVSENEIETNFGQLKIPAVTTGRYCATLIKYSDVQNQKTMLQQNTFYYDKQTLSHTIQQEFAVMPFIKLVDIDFETQVLILGGAEEQLIQNNFTLIIKNQQNFDIFGFTVSIGSLCKNLRDISSSYRNACHIFEMSKFSDETAPIITENLITSLKPQEALYYSLQTEKDLMQAVISGKKDVCKHIVFEIIQTNQYKGLFNIPQLSLMFSTTVQRILDSLQKKQTDFFEQTASPYIILASSTTFEALQDNMNNIFTNIMEKIQSEKNKVNPVVIETLLAFIQQNYFRDISLDELSDSVNLTPNYVSAVFKNATGQNFKSYLNKLRFDMACSIINQEPLKKIKTVAQEVGCSTEILSRIFIKYAGILPSDYQFAVAQDTRTNNS